MTNSPVVLIVDDELHIRESFRVCLEKKIQKGLIDTKTTVHGKEGVQVIRHNNQEGKPTLAFIDIILGDISGDKIVELIKPNPTITRGILISAHKYLPELEEIKKKCDWITNCYEKPVADEIIIEEVSNFLKHSEVSQFDYSSLDTETAKLIQTETEKIRSIIKKTADNIIDIGGSLHKVKERLDHGKFTYWVESELGLDYGSASNFMRVWDTFNDCREQIRHFGLNVSILYLMAARNTPQEFRDEVFRRAKTGNPLSFSEAKQLRKEYLERSEIQQQKSDTQDDLISEENIITIDVKYSSDSTSPSQKTRQQPPKSPLKSKDDSSTPASSTPEKLTQTVNDPKSSKKAETSKPGIPETQKQQIIKKVETPKPTIQDNQKKQIINVIREQKVWNLKKHILYCGLPNSEEFRNLVDSSPRIALNLGFPNFTHWNQDNLFPVKANSTTVHHTLFPKVDLIFLLKIVKDSIEYLTEGGEFIVFAFLPDPELLLLAEKLESKSFIAEPNPQKCQAIISRWRRYELDGQFPRWEELDFSENT